MSDSRFIPAAALMQRKIDEAQFTKPFQSRGAVQTSAIQRPCSYPGCPNLSPSGRCVEHSNRREDRRKTAERGYDGDWRKLRLLKLATDPFCQIRIHCDGTTATEVDHRIPLSERPDLRLCWDNLQSACKPCNSAKRDREKVHRNLDQSSNLTAESFTLQGALSRF